MCVWFLQRILTTKPQEKGKLTANCNLLHLFGTEFQKSNSVIVCHKKSEDRGTSLGKMDI